MYILCEHSQSLQAAPGYFKEGFAMEQFEPPLTIQEYFCGLEGIFCLQPFQGVFTPPLKPNLEQLQSSPCARTTSEVVRALEYCVINFPGWIIAHYLVLDTRKKMMGMNASFVFK